MNIIEGIKNLIKWFPLVWKDRDWDYHFLYEILHFKLKNMEKFFSSDKTYSVVSPKNAKQIKIARILLGRLLECDYLENAMMFYNKKYGNQTIMNIDDDGVVKWVDNKKMIEEFRKCGSHSDFMEIQDNNYLFDLLKKHAHRWWD